jgi:carbon-monoxide dehydrogenase small subunit
MDSCSSVEFCLNGVKETVEIPNTETLMETLRDRFGLTSVRSTCNIGMCGVCTVELNGEIVSSCLLLTATCAGATILTVEGLEDEAGRLDPVQEAFLEHRAFQCSYCTPAMILATRALLREQPQPTEDTARHFLSGNTCRCGSHPQVMEAIESLTKREFIHE